MLLLGFSFMLGGIYCLLYKDEIKSIGSQSIHEPHSIEGELDFSIQRRRLSLQLLYFIPSFPIVYILSAVKVINHDITVVAFMLCNISTKIIFVAILLCAHVEVLYVLFVTERNINAAKRKFLRYIMHEVRVPLSSVVMGIQVMEGCEYLNEEEKDTIVMMKGATDFMRETLNDILCMQKIEEGKLELSYTPFVLTDVLKSVKLSLRGLLHERDIQLFTSVQDTLPHIVIGDRYRVEHVLANLLSNAIKFSPRSGRIFILITGSSIDQMNIHGGNNCNTNDIENNISPSTCSVRFAIRDEGPGISIEEQQNLFSAFYQIRPGEMQKGEGSGVGLSICKQIVEFHGGTIHCESEPGVGSTFSFVIPFQVNSSNLNDKRNVLEEATVSVSAGLKSNPKSSPTVSYRRKRASAYTPLTSLIQAPPRILVVDGKLR